jgi:hypothetical protein
VDTVLQSTDFTNEGKNASERARHPYHGPPVPGAPPGAPPAAAGAPPVDAANSEAVDAGGGLDGNYATSQGNLNTSVPLVIDAHGNTSCKGLTAYGGVGTFYAIAIQEATTTLTTYGRSSAKKYTVSLSDGDANSNDGNMSKGYNVSNSSVGTFTDTSSSGNVNECHHQGITALLHAQAAGITVIIMGFGEDTGSTNSSGSSAACKTAVVRATLPGGTEGLVFRLRQSIHRSVRGQA